LVAGLAIALMGTAWAMSGGDNDKQPIKIEEGMVAEKGSSLHQPAKKEE